LAACDDAFPQLPPHFDRYPSDERLRRTAQQPLRCDLALVVPNLRVRHRIAQGVLVCTIDGQQIAQVADNAAPDETTAFLSTIRDALRARVEQFVGWSPPERTVWLLRQLGITVLLTGRQHSWIPSPQVWVVSHHAPFDQINRLLLEVLPVDQWFQWMPDRRTGWGLRYQPGETVWNQLDLMLFVILGMPVAPLVRHNSADIEGCYRELCRLVGFADRTTLLRRFARRVLTDVLWVHDTRLNWSSPYDPDTHLLATVKTTGVDQVHISVTRTGASEQWVPIWSEPFSTSS